MATFKAVVQHHQQRKDGKFPISVRVTHNRKSFYVSTGLYCTISQINRKTFEIKDQFLITRIFQIISDYEKRLLTFNTAHLGMLSLNELKKILSVTPSRIDYIGYCRRLIADNHLKWRLLGNCLKIFDDMGIKDMCITDFNSSFLRKFKDYLDNTAVPVTKNGIIVGHKHYAQNTKKTYLVLVGQVFRLIRQEYNSEFSTVISHDPFIGIESYKRTLTKKRSMSVDELRRFLSIDARLDTQQVAIDLMRLSFCLCGINLIDIFSLEKDAFDYKSMRISYMRRKTRDRTLNNSFVSVRIEPEIYDILGKYLAPKDSKYLFRFETLCGDYNSTMRIGHRVKSLCEANGMDPMTPYWFRHTWATIARNDCDVSKDDIDLCLGHTGNNPMADVYIRPDWSRVDKANRKVLDYVFGIERNEDD